MSLDEELARQREELESLRQQLSAALAACKQKDEALNRVWLKVIKGFSTTEWAFLAKAMAIRPDAAALEQFAAKVREQCAEVCEAEYVNVADGDDEVYNSAITHASRGIRAIKELP